MDTRSFSNFAAAVLAACTVANAWVGPPPNPTASDSNLNTAAGTGVLSLNTGSFNTGVGSHATNTKSQNG